MAGGKNAVASGAALEEEVEERARSLGLDVRRQYQLGRRIWGSQRHIDVILTHPEDRRRLGVECKFQRVAGSAEEKVPLVIQDLETWPIPGIIVFAGGGFTPHMQTYLRASGKAIHLDELESWLRLFFGLELPD